MGTFNNVPFLLFIPFEESSFGLNPIFPHISIVVFSFGGKVPKSHFGTSLSAIALSSDEPFTA